MLPRNLRFCRHCVHWTKTMNCTGHDLGRCALNRGGKVTDSTYDKELNITISEISTKGGSLALSHWTCKKFKARLMKPKQERVSMFVRR